MLEDFLSPVDLNRIRGDKPFLVNQWGNQLDIYKDEFPDLMKAKLAIIGVEEDRTNDSGGAVANAPDTIRKFLYRMYNWESGIKIVDVGNIKRGDRQKDTYFALGRVMRILLNDGIIPIILGGTHDLSTAQFKGHSVDGKFINAAFFDERIDVFPTEEGEDLNPETYLYDLLNQKSGLFNLSMLGYQRYLVDPNMVEMLDKMHFECMSLGEIRDNLGEVEPILRYADMVSFDISVIRYGDAPGVSEGTPHGLMGEEACRIARYAGISEQVQSFGLYQFNPAFDQNNQTARLVAQMIWYFAAGFCSRKVDQPNEDERGYFKYIAYFKENDHEIIFLKSRKTDRWWMKVPIVKKGIPEGYELIPCSYSEYERALKDDTIPDRWMKAYWRLSD